MSEAKLAAQYERLHPQTGIPDAQKAERQDRRNTNARHRSGHPMRIVTPEGVENLQNDRPAARWEEIGPGRYRRISAKEQ